MVWLHPEEYADSWGYQTIQALYAIGSGGFFGRGLGNSIQKLGSVPEAQNDMIFSIICEELGIFGGLIVLMLYAYLLYLSLIHILYHTEDKNIYRRKELYTEEGRQYYKGNLWIPDDLETYKL